MTLNGRSLTVMLAALGLAEAGVAFGLQRAWLPQLIGYALLVVAVALVLWTAGRLKGLLRALAYTAAFLFFDREAPSTRRVAGAGLGGLLAVLISTLLVATAHGWMASNWMRQAGFPPVHATVHGGAQPGLLPVDPLAGMRQPEKQ